MSPRGWLGTTPALPPWAPGGGPRGAGAGRRSAPRNPAAAAYRELIDDDVAGRRGATPTRARRSPAPTWPLTSPSQTAPHRRARSSAACASPCSPRHSRWRRSCAGSVSTGPVGSMTPTCSIIDRRAAIASTRSSGRRSAARPTPRRRRRAGRGGALWLRASTTSRRPSARTVTGWPSWCSWPSRPTSGSRSSRGPTGAPSSASTRSPTRSSTSCAPAASRASGSSASGSAARPPDASSSCAATPTPWPRRTRWPTTGSPTSSAATRPGETCATAPPRGASASQPTWSPTTWASTRAGSSSSRSASSRARPALRGVRFDGEDLSPDDRVVIQIEDHYWDSSDAAVVFKRIDRASGETRYIYHGNDGTSFPWNDTAQLDYLQAEVREAVIGQILEVARRFPVIRFDAAMVLAQRHIQRLWYPLPGHGGGHPLPRGGGPARPRAAARACPPSSGARSWTASPPRCPTRSCSRRRSGCWRATSCGRWACTASTTAPSCTCCATSRTRSTSRSSARPWPSTRASWAATSTS